MNNDLSQNAVAAIRVSSMKQGVNGDSPEAQKEQIEQFAKLHNYKITKFFTFLESASKDQQPIQEAIDYCTKPENDIQVFIIKSIDRFTRGGSYLYEDLKMQLDKSNVQLIDIYGVIGREQINTLEHLGMKFKWSVYSPTKKTEMLEAERAKDEMRDIMSRMIGAEIRYARMGYWVRNPPTGYQTEKIETPNGKRTILKPHPQESIWLRKMFELRCRGNLTDLQIVEEVNNLGFRTRKMYHRDKQDRTKILHVRGNNKLDVKRLSAYIKNPIYAGINYTKWTKSSPHKGKFDGLVSIDTFNKANGGKIVIIEEDGDKVRIQKPKTPDHLLKKGVRNPDFPYKRIVMCPHCEKPLYGSASRGRSGKYYPAYHCNKRGHHFRIPKKKFDQTVKKFVQNIEIAPGYVDSLVQTVIAEWERRENQSQTGKIDIDKRITELKSQAQLTADKIRYLTSEVAIKYIEEDLVKIDGEIGDLMVQKKKEIDEKPTDATEVMTYIKYFLEHTDELLVNSKDPEARALHFGILFDKAPTYEQLDSGTTTLSECIKLNEVFTVAKGDLATPNGLEPSIFSVTGRHVNRYTTGPQVC